MTYTPLWKLYYQNPEEYETVYKSYMNSPVTQYLGVEIRQYNHEKSYPAFMLYTREILLLAEEIDRLHMQLVDIVHHVPPEVLKQFALLCIVDEVKSTNDIEGVRSTKQEIRNILNEKSAETTRLNNVVNKYKSLITNEPFQFKACEDIRHFYDNFAYADILAETEANKLDGEIFRKEAVDIETNVGRIIHRGAFPESKIINLMNQALAILNNEEIPFLVRISVFHFLFGYIHPFYDGNGRTNRFITSYYLAQRFHKVISLRLSIIIKKNRKKYYDLFSKTEEEFNRGDLTDFTIGFIKLIRDTDKYLQKLKELNIQDELTREIYIILLQSALFYGQGVTVSDIVKATGKSRNTVQVRIAKIPANHIIKNKNKKTIYYKLNLLLFNK